LYNICIIGEIYKKIKTLLTKKVPTSMGTMSLLLAGYATTA
jgi:hypothetical protein